MLRFRDTQLFFCPITPTGSSLARLAALAKSPKRTAPSTLLNDLPRYWYKTLVAPFNSPESKPPFRPGHTTIQSYWMGWPKFYIETLGDHSVRGRSFFAFRLFDRYIPSFLLKRSSSIEDRWQCTTMLTNFFWVLTWNRIAIQKCRKNFK